ncbi:MAG: DUF2339 domain-containing protein [Comamonadaceae bacterium]|nr:MAG: DUF2339 domain-containing protein [Comamonadaceae bacterium]
MQRPPASPLDGKLQALEARLSPLLFWAGFLWFQFGLQHDIAQATFGDADRYGSRALQMHLMLLAWVGAAFALHFLACRPGLRAWPVAATPAWTVLPVLLLGAIATGARFPHVFVQGGWLAWPLLVVLHVAMLRRLDAAPPERWWRVVHAGGVGLAVLLGGNLLLHAVRSAELGRTAWAAVILLTAGTAVLLVLCLPAVHAARPSRWPLDRYARSYAWMAGLPLAMAVAFGALVAAVTSSGNARPLPYVPLLNPTDLAVALALAACALWLLRLERGAHAALAEPLRQPARIALGVLAFVAVNTVWLRTVHHYAGVPWEQRALFHSFLVQAGFSILWTLLALGLMLAAFRAASRRTWLTGAGLLGVTVAKLFLVDLSNRGAGKVPA